MTDRIPLSFVNAMSQPNREAEKKHQAPWTHSHSPRGNLSCFTRNGDPNWLRGFPKHCQTFELLNTATQLLHLGRLPCGGLTIWVWVKIKPPNWSHFGYLFLTHSHMLQIQTNQQQFIWRRCPIYPPLAPRVGVLGVPGGYCSPRARPESVPGSQRQASQLVAGSCAKKSIFFCLVRGKQRGPPTMDEEKRRSYFWGREMSLRRPTFAQNKHLF